MRTFPRYLHRFQEMINERGQRLRRLTFEELERLDACNAETVIVDSRPATISIIVQPREDDRLRVVIQGFIKPRFFPGKHVALDGFYKLRMEPSTQCPITSFTNSINAPFGEDYNGSGTTDLSFTGQTQDTTSTVGGLYDFQFREYAARQGRWVSPDPAGMAVAETWGQTERSPIFSSCAFGNMGRETWDGNMGNMGTDGTFTGFSQAKQPRPTAPCGPPTRPSLGASDNTYSHSGKHCTISLLTY